MKKIYHSLPLIVSSLVVFIISAQPTSPFILKTEWGEDKIWHFVGYFIYGIAAQIFSIGYFKTKMQILSLAFVISFVFALSDEIHQYFVPGRSCDIFDLLADCLGISISLFFYNFVSNILKKLNGKNE